MRTKKQVQQDSARSLAIKKIIDSEHSKEAHVHGLREKTVEDMAYENKDVHRDAPFDPNDMDLIFSKWER